uniref:Uncharacterized protein n=1 Tax=Calidris pygmaea TaxID=425635 RepID=A0A8C3K5H2_9CHAR
MEAIALIESLAAPVVGRRCSSGGGKKEWVSQHLPPTHSPRDGLLLPFGAVPGLCYCGRCGCHPGVTQDRSLPPIPILRLFEPWSQKGRVFPSPGNLHLLRGAETVCPHEQAGANTSPCTDTTRKLPLKLLISEKMSHLGGFL